MQKCKTKETSTLPKRVGQGLRKRRRRGGTSIVEFVLVSPVLLGMAMGIIDFGWLERNSLVVANAAREGARAAALGQSTSNIRARITNSGSYSLRTDAGGNITNGSILMQHAPPAATPVYVAWPSDNTTGTTPRNGVPQGNYVRITVIYNHRSITGLFNRAVSIPVIMRREY